MGSLSFYLVTLVFLQAFTSNHAQTAIPCTNTCAENYPYPSSPPTACCGCCSAESCHSIAELTLCCLPDQAFCGCLSDRAYCVGSGYNTTVFSTFGTCYDPNVFSCSYDPSPNIWTLCPKDYTACEVDESYYSCCDPNSVCTSTGCVSQEVCVDNCVTNYPYPSSPPTACCGCCGSGSCNSIAELTLCCQPDQAFCGCLSDRAYCGGSGYNTSITSTFGTCYDPTVFFCSYDPSPNIWTLCPHGYTACEVDESYYSCCAPNSVCSTTNGCVAPTVPTTQATTAPTLAPNQCGNQQCCIARSNPNAQTGDGYLQFSASCLQGGLHCVGNSGCQTCHSSAVPNNPTNLPICGQAQVNVGVCFTQQCCQSVMNPNPTTGHGYLEYDASCLNGGLHCVGKTGCKNCYQPVPNGNAGGLPTCNYSV